MLSERDKSTASGSARSTENNNLETAKSMEGGGVEGRDVPRRGGGGKNIHIGPSSTSPFLLHSAWDSTPSLGFDCPASGQTKVQTATSFKLGFPQKLACLCNLPNPSVQWGTNWRRRRRTIKIPPFCSRPADGSTDRLPQGQFTDRASDRGRQLVRTIKILA